MHFPKGIGRKARALAMRGEVGGGQGTTEYAVLIAVLVIGLALVIALFRDQLGAIWNAATAQLQADANTQIPGA